MQQLVGSSDEIAAVAAAAAEAPAPAVAAVEPAGEPAGGLGSSGGRVDAGLKAAAAVGPVLSIILSGSLWAKP